MVRKAWQKMGVISSGYTVCNLDISHNAEHLLLSTVHERSWSLHRLTCPSLLTDSSRWAWAQGGGKNRAASPPLCSHMSCFDSQQLDSAPNNLMSKDIQQWKQETNPCGCVAQPSPAPQYSLSKWWSWPEPLNGAGYHLSHKNHQLPWQKAVRK